MPEPFHPGEVVYGTDGQDYSLTCELDEAKPGEILVSVVEDGEFAGGIYVDRFMAKKFGQALLHFADNADYWEGIEDV